MFYPLCRGRHPPIEGSDINFLQQAVPYLAVLIILITVQILQLLFDIFMVEFLPRCFLQRLSQDPAPVTQMTDMISTDAPRIELGREGIGIDPSLTLFITLGVIKWMIDVCFVLV